MRQTVFILTICLAASFRINAQTISYSKSSTLKGASDAVQVKEVPLVHTRQFLPLDKTGTLISTGNLNAQLNQVFMNISGALKQANSSVSQIVKLNVYLKSDDLMAEVQNYIDKTFKTDKKPALSFVSGDLTHSDALVSMDVIAVAMKSNAESVTYMKNDKLSATNHTVASILPAGPVVYISGQAVKGELAEATRGTLAQLEETLHSLGLNRKDIVQIKSFVKPMSDIHVVEREFSQFFKGEIIPPLVNVEWTSKDPVIEIELIASSPKTSVKATEQVEFITPPGMVHSPVYSKVVRVNYGTKIYVSGLYGNKLGDAKLELASIFSSLSSILKSTGSDFDHLAKATYYVGNDTHSAELNSIRPKFYNPKFPPAASKAMVKGLGLNQAGVSIDMIGVVRE